MGEWDIRRKNATPSNADRLAVLKYKREVRALVAAGGEVSCGICEEPIERSDRRRDIHFDHIVPLSLGGLNVLPNIQPTHEECNMAKGWRTTYGRHSEIAVPSRSVVASAVSGSDTAPQSQGGSMDSFVTPKIFEGKHEHFLAQMAKECATPVSALAELGARIERGEANLEKAKAAGNHEAAGKILYKLSELRKECETPQKWDAKRRLYAHVGGLVQALAELTPDGARGNVRVIVSGLFDEAVEINKEEMPF